MTRRKHYNFRYRVTKSGYSLLYRGRLMYKAQVWNDMSRFCDGWCEREQATYSIRPLQFTKM